MNISLSAFAPENLVSRDGFGSPIPRKPAHLHTQAESGAYLRDSSRVPRRRPFIYIKPPYAIGSVPRLSGHAIAYRWCSLPRVHRHRVRKPQCISERVLPCLAGHHGPINMRLSFPHVESTVKFVRGDAYLPVHSYAFHSRRNASPPLPFLSVLLFT